MLPNHELSDEELLDAEDDLKETQGPGKLTDWKNEPSVQTLKEDLEMAKPAHDAQVIKIKKWLQLREAKRKAKDKLKPNRSTIEPKLVRRQNEWRYAPLSEPFLSSEKLFNATPKTFEDTRIARQDEMVVNHQMRTKLNRVKFVDEYVRTAVDEGTVVVRPGWLRDSRMVQKEVPSFSFFPVDPMDQQTMQMLQQAMQMITENPQGFEDLAPEMQEAAYYSQEMGAPFFAQQTGTTLVEEEEVIRNHPTLDIIDYENVYIDPNCNGDLDRANFAVVSFETSKAKMLKDGRYQNLDQVNWANAAPLFNADHATSIMNASHQFKDDLRKVVVAYEYWGFYDVHGNDTLVPIVATWVGDTMVRMEENPYPDKKIPLVVVPYMPIRKSVAGEPDAELLEDNQAILGALTRGMIDLLGKSANGQTGFARGMLDTVNRRRYDSGQDYEFNPNVGPDLGIHQHKYPEIPGSAMTMLQLQNQEAEALTGVKAFSGGLSGEAYGEVAAGIRGLLDAASKREMSILRRMAQGMEEIGRKLITMNQLFMTDEEITQITNEPAIRVNPEDLRGEHNIEVDISTAEVDEAKAQDLGFMLQTLGQTLPFEMTQKILSEIARLKRMPELAHSIETFQPQPDPVAEKLKQLEVAKIEAEIAEEQARAALAQSNAALAQAKIQETMARARALGSDADMKDLDFIEQETGTKHARDMDKLGQQAKANQMLEITKRMLEPGDGDSQAMDLGQALKVRAAGDLLT